MEFNAGRRRLLKNSARGLMGIVAAGIIGGCDGDRNHNEFLSYDSHLVDHIVERATNYRNRYLFSRKENPQIALIKGDVTKNLSLGAYDSVMQLGCFGCLDTEKQFQSAIDNAHSYLKPGGTLLMVTWLDGEVTKVDREYNFNGDRKSVV